jgi:hypothetical protein
MGGLRNLVGSALFNLVFLPGTAVAVMGMILLLPFPRMAMQWAVRNWSWVQHWALKVLVGLDFEVRGRENIAGGAAIYASKHQSAWDTYAYYLLFPDPAYIMKVELMRIPVWGWMAKKCEAISVDRAGGAGALKTRSQPALPTGHRGAVQPVRRAGGAGGAELGPVLGAAQFPQAAGLHHHRVPAGDPGRVEAARVHADAGIPHRGSRRPASGRGTGEPPVAPRPGRRTRRPCRCK